MARTVTRRLPLIRMGLLLVVGSIFVSVMRFYIGLGESLSSMTGEAPSTQPRDLGRYFTEKFLFEGSIAGVLFWVGLALCVAGAVRNVRGVGRKAPRRPDVMP
jgi:hypothetical protein